MRVKMEIRHYDEHKKEIHHYDRTTPKCYFKFELRICREEVVADHGSYSLGDEELGHPLVISELKKIEENRFHYEHFGEYAWTSDGTTINICNRAIHI